jgi:hypothetical protein
MYFEMGIDLVVILLIFGAFTCYALDRSYFLFNKYYSNCLKKRIGFRHGLRFYELNQLLKNPAVSREHKVKFRRYKQFRILGHLFWIGLLISLIINGLFFNVSIA